MSTNIKICNHVVACPNIKMVQGSLECCEHQLFCFSNIILCSTVGFSTNSTAPLFQHHQDSLSSTATATALAKAKYFTDHPGTEKHSPELAAAVEVLLKELCG
jgi:hypothetical protein